MSKKGCSAKGRLLAPAGRGAGRRHGLTRREKAAHGNLVPEGTAKARTHPERTSPESPGLLYRTARALGRLTLRVPFRRIVLRDTERVPLRGPLILAANHPAGAVDGFSISLVTRRKVHFLARSTLFSSKWRARLLESFGMIPVYRRLDAAAQLDRNVEAFRSCFEVLERGGMIGIFPEGVTHVDPQLREIRTGAVRIGLEAEARNEFRLGVRIVPVGLNLSGRETFRGDLIVRVGEAISLDALAGAYEADPEGTVRQMTSELRSRIENLVVHLEDLSQRPVVDAIESLFAADWLRDRSVLPELEDESTREVELRRRIAGAVEYFSRYQPAFVMNTHRHVTGYREALERLSLTDEMLRRRRGAMPLLKETLPTAVVGIIGAPLAVSGWLIHVLPQRITAWVAKRLAAEQTQVEAHRMWIGLQAFAAVYALVLFGLNRFAGFGWAGMLVAVLLFPLLGYLSTAYFERLRQYRRSVWLTWLNLRRHGQLQELRLRRAQLARDQERIRRFLSNPGSERTVA